MAMPTHSETDQEVRHRHADLLATLLQTSSTREEKQQEHKATAAEPMQDYKAAFTYPPYAECIDFIFSSRFIFDLRLIGAKLTQGELPTLSYETIAKLQSDAILNIHKNLNDVKSFREFISPQSTLILNCEEKIEKARLDDSKREATAQYSEIVGRQYYEMCKNRDIQVSTHSADSPPLAAFQRTCMSQIFWYLMQCLDYACKNSTMPDEFGLEQTKTQVSTTKPRQRRRRSSIKDLLHRLKNTLEILTHKVPESVAAGMIQNLCSSIHTPVPSSIKVNKQAIIIYKLLKVSSRFSWFLSYRFERFLRYMNKDHAIKFANKCIDVTSKHLLSVPDLHTSTQLAPFNLEQVFKVASRAQRDKSLSKKAYKIVMEGTSIVRCANDFFNAALDHLEEGQTTLPVVLPLPTHYAGFTISAIACDHQSEVQKITSKEASRSSSRARAREEAALSHGQRYYYSTHESGSSEEDKTPEFSDVTAAPAKESDENRSASITAGKSQVLASFTVGPSDELASLMQKLGHASQRPLSSASSAPGSEATEDSHLVSSPSLT